MVDAALGCGDHRWLGMIGNPQAGAQEHRQIIGAIADGQGFGMMQAKLLTQSVKRRKPGRGAQDRLLNTPRNPAIPNDQAIGAVLVELQPGGHAPGK